MKAKLVKESLNEFMDAGSNMSEKGMNVNGLKNKLNRIKPQPTISNVQSWEMEGTILQHENVLELINTSSTLLDIDIVKDCYAWDMISDDHEILNGQAPGFGDLSGVGELFDQYHNKNLVEIADVETDEYDDGGEDAQDWDDEDSSDYDQQDHFLPYSINKFYWDEKNQVGIMECNPYYETNPQVIAFVKK